MDKKLARRAPRSDVIFTPMIRTSAVEFPAKNFAREMGKREKSNLKVPGKRETKIFIIFWETHRNFREIS